MLLNYFKINKSKGYNKFFIQIFAEIQYLNKYLYIALITAYNFWNMIVMIIILGIFYNDLKIIIASLFESGYKLIDKI